LHPLMDPLGTRLRQGSTHFTATVVGLAHMFPKRLILRCLPALNLPLIRFMNMPDGAISALMRQFIYSIPRLDSGGLLVDHSSVPIGCSSLNFCTPHPGSSSARSGPSVSAAKSSLTNYSKPHSKPYLWSSHLTNCSKPCSKPYPWSSHLLFCAGLARGASPHSAANVRGEEQERSVQQDCRKPSIIDPPGGVRGNANVRAVYVYSSIGAWETGVSGSSYSALPSSSSYCSIFVCAVFIPRTITEKILLLFLLLHHST
jgi:hypothetical protein